MNLLDCNLKTTAGLCEAWTRFKYQEVFTALRKARGLRQSHLTIELADELDDEQRERFENLLQVSSCDLDEEFIDEIVERFSYLDKHGYSPDKVKPWE